MLTGESGWVEKLIILPFIILNALAWGFIADFHQRVGNFIIKLY
jgi:hypothetical protein